MYIPNIVHFGHKVIKHTRHHVEKVSKMLYEKGDPNFVDERKKPKLPKEEESFFDSLLNFWTK